jgi:hypothetical protein
MDNNGAENVPHPFVIGRKHGLFSKSRSGAQSKLELIQCNRNSRSQWATTI